MYSGHQSRVTSGKSCMVLIQFLIDFYIKCMQLLIQTLQPFQLTHICWGMQSALATVLPINIVQVLVEMTHVVPNIHKSFTHYVCIYTYMCVCMCICACTMGYVPYMHVHADTSWYQYT